MPQQYRRIPVPEEIIGRIDRIVTNRAHGYTSRTQFVLAAVRDLLEKFDEGDAGMIEFKQLNNRGR